MVKWSHQARRDLRRIFDYIAPLEIRRTDLDSAPVAGILRRLKETGKLVLDGVRSGEQASLFEANQ